MMIKLTFTVTFFYIKNLLHLTGSPRPPTVEMKKQVSRRASRFGQGPSLRIGRWSLHPKSSKAKAWAPSFITQQMKMTALLNWGRHPLLPQGHWLMSGYIFVCHKLGRRASTGYWHLVSWGQRCCEIPHCTRQPITTKNYPAQKYQQCQGWETLPYTHHKGAKSRVQWPVSPVLLPWLPCWGLLLSAKKLHRRRQRTLGCSEES